MDLDYNVHSMEFTLTKISAVKVVHQLLLASGQEHVALERRKEIETDAVERVKRLDIPKDAKELLEMLVKPISEELECLYNRHRGFDSFTSPVFTPQGTLNLLATTRAIVERKNVDSNDRFTISCRFCHKSHAYKMLDNLTTDLVIVSGLARLDYFSLIEILPVDLARLWLDAFQRSDDKGLVGLVLPKTLCDESFAIALQKRNEVAIRYFIGKASPEAVPRIILQYYKYYRFLTPTTYGLLFSNLNETQQTFLIRYFSYFLLIVLLKWPYHQLFLKAASTLCRHLEKTNYQGILGAIARKVVQGYKDYNYQELFVEFWKLVIIHKGEISLKGSFGNEVAFMVCMTGDENLLSFVLNGISASDKEVLLSCFYQNNICETLLCNEEYKLLELFLKGCAMGNIARLEQLRDNFVDRATHVGNEDAFCGYHFFRRNLKKEDWAAEKLRLAVIVNRIISENLTPAQSGSESLAETASTEAC